MDEKTYTIIQKESWPTKINNFFGIFWKVILVFILFSVFLGINKEDTYEEINLKEANFNRHYLDHDGLIDQSAQKNSLPQIALIEISGIIAESELGGMLDPIEQKRSDTIRKLQYIKNNPEIKALILRINSPGGTVYDSDLIAEKVSELKQSGIKIIALLEEQAASGGYYIASQADLIIAHDLTLTGSIGSIIQLPNASELLEKIGVKFNNVASGKNKAMGDFSRDMSTEELAIFQDMIDESYERFLDFVETGRNIPREELRAIADGRIYTGKQAHKLKLVDRLGRYPQAVQAAEELLAIEQSQIFQLNIKKDPYDLFFESFGNFKAFFQTRSEVEMLKSLNMQSRIFYM